MTNTELDGQIQWFKDLREALIGGDYESVGSAIDAAIKLLERETEARRRRP